MRSRYLCMQVFVVLFLSFSAGVLQGAEREVVIGYAVSITGKFAEGGNDTQRGYQVWLDRINKEGGLPVGNQRRPVKFVSYDDESDASNCAKLYERLINRDKVDLVLSPWGSGNNFAASAVTEKYHYPLIMVSGAAENIFERGFKYIFETSNLPTTHMETWRDFLKAYKNDIKTAAILYENFLFTVSMDKALTGFIEEAGVKLVMNEKYPLSGKDFTGLLLKVKAMNPDALFVLNIMPASIYVTRQAREVGVTPKVFMVNIGPMFREEFIVALGDLSEKVFETGFWHRDLLFRGNKEFAAAYETKYGKECSSNSADAYTSCQLLEQAVKKAGTTDREKVAEVLHKEKFESIRGPFEYDARGVNKVQKDFINQVQNRKRVIVWPKELASAKPEFMR